MSSVDIMPQEMEYINMLLRRLNNDPALREFEEKHAMNVEVNPKWYSGDTDYRIRFDADADDYILVISPLDSGT